jgi:hypothetical protein
MRQTRAMGLSIIGSARATREDRTERARTICPLCGRLFRRAGRLCKPCATRRERQAQAAQERDYLAAWLSTRDDDHSLLAERLRAKARALGVDWLRDLPAPLLFKDRLEADITTAVRGMTITRVTQVTGTLQNGRVRGNARRGGAVKPKLGTSGHHQTCQRPCEPDSRRPGMK